jgi:hypothetical protein
MTKEEIINNYKKDRNITDDYKLDEDENYFVDKLYEAINYTRCCTTFYCDDESECNLSRCETQCRVCRGVEQTLPKQ